MVCGKRLVFSHVFTSYLYYAICISKREYERLSVTISTYAYHTWTDPTFSLRTLDVTLTSL